MTGYIDRQLASQEALWLPYHVRMKRHLQVARIWQNRGTKVSHKIIAPTEYLGQQDYLFVAVKMPPHESDHIGRFPTME